MGLLMPFWPFSYDELYWYWNLSNNDWDLDNTLCWRHAEVVLHFQNLLPWKRLLLALDLIWLQLILACCYDPLWRSRGLNSFLEPKFFDCSYLDGKAGWIQVSIMIWRDLPSSWMTDENIPNGCFLLILSENDTVSQVADETVEDQNKLELLREWHQTGTSNVTGCNWACLG